VAWQRLEAIVERLQAAWRSDQRPAVDAYPRSATAERQTLLIELVHEELEFRLQAGESVRVENHLDRYPELRAEAAIAVELIAAEYSLRQQRGEGRTPEKYLARFPEYADPLCGMLAGPGTPDASGVEALKVMSGSPAVPTTVPPDTSDDAAAGASDMLGRTGPGSGRTSAISSWMTSSRGRRRRRTCPCRCRRGLAVGSTSMPYGGICRSPWSAFGLISSATTPVPNILASDPLSRLMLTPAEMAERDLHAVTEVRKRGIPLATVL
jgi:hypothetical protein